MREANYTCQKQMTKRTKGQRDLGLDFSIWNESKQWQQMRQVWISHWISCAMRRKCVQKWKQNSLNRSTVCVRSPQATRRSWPHWTPPLLRFGCKNRWVPSIQTRLIWLSSLFKISWSMCSYLPCVKAQSTLDPSVYTSLQPRNGHQSVLTRCVLWFGTEVYTE